MSVPENKYLPPLVSMNKLRQHVDCKSSLNETNLNIGGYIRISTQKDSQLTSIENQKKYLREWADVNGYNISRFYIDMKSGAYTYLRNEMSQLREDIKNAKIRGIVSKEISRTSRDIMDILELKRSLADYGAFFLSIKEGYDSRTDDDEFLLVIHAGLAQKERKVTASRVKITQILKAKEGKTNVPSPAYGYRLSEDKQHITVDRETSKIYKLIIEKFLLGWGQLKICKWLNQQGIPAKRSEKWCTNSIKTILSNPVYLGITIYNATTLTRNSQGKQKRLVRPQEDWIIRENTHEPLISTEDYNKIQEIMKQRKEQDKKQWSCEKKYLLSGFLYCDVCNCKIFGYKTVSKDRITKTGEPYTFYSYVDQNRYGTCNTKTKYWNMKRLDAIVLGEIKNFFKDTSLIEERIKAKQYLYNRDLSYEKEKLEIIKGQIEKIDNAIRKQQEAYENDAISISEYKTRMNELRESKKKAANEIQGFEERLKNSDAPQEIFFKIKDKVMSMIENLENLDHETLDLLLKKLVKRILVKQDYTIFIEYTFDE